RIEDERMRIAREIHDELGASLTMVRLELAALSHPAGADRRDATRLEGVVERLDQAIESTRRISSDLRPSLLDNMGLIAAIEALASDVQQRTGIRCRVSLEGMREEPDLDRATALFRIVQEAITNAIRHAHASTVQVGQR